MQKIRGISLIEFMIAMGLSVVVTAGALSLFSSHKANFLYLQGLSRIQENGRFLLHVLQQDMRMAGFMGCLNLSKITPNIIVNSPSANLSLFNNTAILGYEGKSGAHAPALPAHLNGKVREGTDVIAIFKGQSQTLNLQTQMASPAMPLAVTDRSNISDGNVVLVADCESADLFAANDNSNNTLINPDNSHNLSNSLSKAYDASAQVMLFDSDVYYIGDSGRTNQNGDSIFALYRTNIQGTDEELVEGVENMQITYGVDTNADQTVDQFLDAEAVASANMFQNVLSVKIETLVTSVDPVTGDTEPYVFQGQTTTPGDLMLRKPWSVYIQLRNI